MFIPKDVDGHVSLDFRVGGATSEIKPREPDGPKHKQYIAGIVSRVTTETCMRVAAAAAAAGFLAPLGQC